MSTTGTTTEGAIDGAERRMGLTVPPVLRRWLLEPATAPAGLDLLGLPDMERVHRHRTALAADADPAAWRAEWLPIEAGTEGFHGTFLDTRTGTVGSWTEGSDPRENTHPSLAAHLHPPEPPSQDALHRWARERGITLHHRGRVPQNIREAYQESP
ncbi:hypothetical protein V2W30_23630 [Streptomyces sp. Q6]|uniref:Uncharacterized protein n=1 Tax=Streptomyces citrinus TaxID=3118173 RepID=A0ACD5AFM8_9ACTN